MRLHGVYERGGSRVGRVCRPVGQQVPYDLEVVEKPLAGSGPISEVPPEIRTGVYTTNAIESLNYSIQRVIRHRQMFPNDEATLRMKLGKPACLVGAVRTGLLKTPCVQALVPIAVLQWAPRD